MSTQDIEAGYSPEILDRIEADHKSGRLMPFIEFLLADQNRVLRFLREGDRYICTIGPEEATELLRATNQAYGDK